jgi:Uma2 family endonuclease
MAVHEPLIRVGMSVDELIEQYDEAPFELINGEVRLLLPNLPRHNMIVSPLLRQFHTLEESASIFSIYETPYLLIDPHSQLEGTRTPDIMIFSQARLDAYIADNPDWLDKPFVIVPDLCIEVVSKNDKMPEVMSKVETYLDDGVKLVWVFEPKTRTVTVRTLGSQQATILRADDRLEGGGVVAGFNVRVGDILI